MVEFNSIEHALAVQDEADREDMQLIGKTKLPKMPESKGVTPRYTNTLGIDSEDTTRNFKEQMLRGSKINSSRNVASNNKETLKAYI